MMTKTYIGIHINKNIINFIIVILHFWLNAPTAFYIVSLYPHCSRSDLSKLQIWLISVIFKTLQDLPITSREHPKPLHPSAFSGQALPASPATFYTIP